MSIISEGKARNMAIDHQDSIVTTQPPSPEGQKLVEAFAEEPAQQAARYDDVAKEMMKLLLGVPGAYLAVLKLGADQHFSLQTAGLVLTGLAFASWGGALFAAFRALFPRPYNVMRNVPYRVGEREAGGKLTIEEFYREAAAYKGTFLKVSAVLFFAGILLALSSFLFI